MTVTSRRTHSFQFKRVYGNENSSALKMGCCCSSPGGDDEREHLLQSNSKTQTESARQSHPAANGADQKTGRLTARHVGENDLDERFSDVREHLLQSNSKTQTESARQSHPAANGADQKTGRFTARHVGVNDLDERFNDVAETFNKQQEHYETMKNILQTVANRYQCPTNDSLTQCLKKVKEEHGNCYISLEVKGYDFTLMVRSEAEIPTALKMTKDNITELSKATKAIISVATKLQEMIDWLLKKEDSMTTQLESTDHSHQDKKRLLDNLKENLREARRAKETSPKYRKEAGNLLNEAAVLSGITP